MTRKVSKSIKEVCLKTWGKIKQSIQDVKAEAGMRKQLIGLMKRNDAPKEQYIRLGLNDNGWEYTDRNI